MVHAAPHTTHRLRPYQEECLRQLADSYRRGNRRVLLCCPTGGGKSLLGATVVKGALAKGRRVLWVAHRAELVHQAASTLRSVTGARVGIVQAQTRADPSASIQVASIQTLVRRGATPPASLVVCDEAHRMLAKQWDALLSTYKEAHFLHLTATPERGDGQPLAHLADDLVGSIQPADLIRDGFLVPCEVVAPTFDPAKGIAQDPVDAYLRWGGGRRGVTFCQSQEHARAVGRNFTAAGVPAAVVLAESSWDYRAYIYKRLREGEYRMLVNVFVATEGLDIPELEVCIIARTMGHAAMFVQAAGRVMRPAPGKDRATLIDLKGVVDRYGTPESDRVYSLDGDEAVRLEDRGARDRLRCPSCSSIVTGTPCPVCGHQGETASLPEIESIDLELRPSSVARPSPSPPKDDRGFYFSLIFADIADIALGRLPSTACPSRANLLYLRDRGRPHDPTWQALAEEHLRGKLYPYPSWWPSEHLPREAVGLGHFRTRVEVDAGQCYGVTRLPLPFKDLKFLTVR